ncbi:hypothetical protein N7507_009436 [Penicillium longicatenatum]|nr:hypothetical protein N7507_009436 [Penicillium longicatenatum]
MEHVRHRLRGLFHRHPKNTGAEGHPIEKSESVPEDKEGKPLEKPTPQESLAGRTTNLWQRAEIRLNSNPDKRQLIQAAHAALTADLGEELEPSGTSARQAQLSRLFQHRVNALERQKWRIQFGDHEVAIQDLVASTFEKVLVVKGLVDTAASASPPAALACAGLSVVFTLALQATTQQAALLETLDYSSDLMCRFQVMEDVYRLGENASHGPPGHRAELLEKFEEHLTDLYAIILEFQARALYYMGKHSFGRTLSDAFEHDGWNTILGSMKSLETNTEKDAQLIGAANVDQKLNEIQNSQRQENARRIITDRDQKAFEFLRALYNCPYKDRKDRNDVRVPGTCEWFTHHHLFESWHQTEGSSLLWVSADPGCGKSVLTKYLVDEFLPDLKKPTICYFFFKDDFSDQNTATSALCAILRQIFLAHPQLLRDPILTKFGTDGERLTKSFNDLWSIFTNVTADPKSGEIIFILDALDECQKDGRDRLIEAVTRFQQGGPKSANVKFLITSRPYLDIYREIQGNQQDLSRVHLSGEGEEELGQISNEINLVTRKRVEDICRERRLTSNQAKMLIDELLPVVDRTYLWVTLTMDVIRSTPSFTKGNIRAAVKQLPATVDDAYEKILTRSPTPERARTILHAILAAERPLSVSEMALIVACEQAFKESVDIEDFLESEDDFKQTLREICGLFVVIIHSRLYLLHQTAREFLVGSKSASKSASPLNQVSTAIVWKGSFDLQVSNRLLVDVCVRYLTSGKCNELKALEEYSKQNWVTHFKSCPIGADDSITPLAGQLCGSGEQSSLEFAFSSGLPYVVEYLIKVEKHGGGTFLVDRAREGRVDLVQMILEHAVDVTSSSGTWGIPLQMAIVNGHLDVVQVFLENGVDLTPKNGFSDPSICFAASQGNEKILDILIKHGADVNTRDLLGRTLLCLAQGHEAACRLLIEHNAKVE